MIVEIILIILILVVKDLNSLSLVYQEAPNLYNRQYGVPPFSYVPQSMVSY